MVNFKKGWHKSAVEMDVEGVSWREIARTLGLPKSTVSDFLREYNKQLVIIPKSESTTSNYARILVVDIETSSMLLGGWGLFNQNFSIEQIERDWTVISYSAKWLGEDDVFYTDINDVTEKELLQELWDLLDEADFVIAHNGRKFDVKKIKARMIQHGFKPFSPVRIIDTLEVVKQEFGFTSNKLQYLTTSLCKNNVKSTHSTFSGYLLWKEFMKGNKDAIDEMRTYNIIDVESLEELYLILAPWSSKLPNFDVYCDGEMDMSEWEHVGYHYTNLGKYDKYRNKTTGQHRRGRVNLLSAEKRKQLLGNII